MRPARALIDLQALRHNYRLARRLGGGRALAVVKADAYGHGAVACARALEAEADGFAVAAIEEALELREAGITAPILLLEGFFEAAELELIDRHRLWTVVQAPWQVEAIARARLSAPLQVWVKLDSGMHRLGLSPAEFTGAWRRLRALPQVAGLVAMTHFARADELDSSRTAEQAAVFSDVLAGLDERPVASLCNSAAILGWPAVLPTPPADRDADAERSREEGGTSWARPGLMLYGANPFAGPHAGADLLRPVMTVESKLIAVRELAAGEPVGYGARYVTPMPMRIGVVAMGYADGYPQFAPDGTPVSIDGRPGRLAGRVSMDMLTVDLSGHPDATVGTPVQLWGDRVRADELARHCGTSAYELLCGLKRMPRGIRGA
ncbi:alanine racemase [Lysobacter sp. GX 14042]|uniref:alanine racemase n=1 Tax=Lysobacter sp. GX 14042 TaxID=2907155 RepID=UPI001F447489|nr:alanine racemase [Lysobacter sp. GX 14042]MCE7032103.1 alanine racemase [Lysobacter sp. GX 14042]